MADKLRFDQRHGNAALPIQLRPDEVSTELKAKLWAGLHLSIKEAREPRDYRDDAIGEPWHNVLYRWHVREEHRPSDEFNPTYDHAVSKVKSLIYVDDFTALYTFLEFIGRSSKMAHERSFIAFALEDSRAAWRLIDGEIIPVSSSEEAGAIAAALAEVRLSAPEGAKAHLANSSRLVAAGDWAGSVRESIHAVETIACTFEDATTLADALKAIQRSGRIHPALAKGFIALYGYTSDESGIRHALLEAGASEVGEREALFMFAACASFCQYLLNAVRPD